MEDHRIVLPDGSVKHIHAIGHPMFDAAGEILEYVGTLADVTEHKQAEETRRELEEQWKAAYEHNPTMYFIIDAAGGIVSANSLGAEQLGYGVGELIGQPVLNVFYEPDWDAVQKHVRDCFEQPGRTMVWEARKIRKDGTMLWVRETANAVVLKKQPVLLVVCENITEQKHAEDAARRSEKELRDVIETMPAMAFSIGPDGSTAFVNRQVLEYTGLSTETVSGLGWQSTVHPDDVEGHLNKWRVSFASGVPFENEARHRSANGDYRWFLVRAVALRDEHGNVLKWYGTLTDIEDRKRAEALLTGEKRILEMVARGDSLTQILDSLCRLVEEQASGVLASVLLVDNGRLRHGGAPSLPKAYTDAIDGVVIGPAVGSCGTAAYCEEQVIVEDIATDPLWADYREAALAHSLRACWSTPIFSAQGKVIATFAMYYRHPCKPSPGDQEIIEQITHLAGAAIERKQTQEALRRSESYLAEAQKLTKTGSLVWDPVTHKTIYCSDEVFRMFGLDPQMGGPAIAELLERVHPEDRDYVTGRSRKGSEDKAGLVVDYRLLLPDGTLKYIHSIRHPILNDAGEVVEFLGTIIDVTEQKRAEETLRRSETYLAEAQRLSHTGSCAWNMVTREVNHSSAEHSRLYGFDPELGIPSLDAIFHRVHPEDRAAVIATLETAFREGTDSENDFRAALPDGTIKYIHAVGHPVFDGAGNLIEFVGTAVDVTERKRAEEERERLRQLETDLARVNRVSMMGELAASLAHEVKQPIAAAVTNAQTSLRWLQREPPDIVEARETVSRIVKNAIRAADIIDRNRALYRGDGPNREILNLNDLIREMIALLRDAADRHSISIHTDLDEALPTMSADRVQMQQVLMNLMLNGIEAMKDTGGELIIRSKKAEDGQILLSVSDFGVGFPVENAERIFDAFFTTKAQGTGMGLSISRRIIESHGGRLWATGNSGQGATFQFIVPTEGKMVETIP